MKKNKDLSWTQTMGKKFNPRIYNILGLATLMIRLYSRTFYYEDKARKATPKTYKRSKLRSGGHIHN